MINLNEELTKMVIGGKVGISNMTNKSGNTAPNQFLLEVNSLLIYKSYDSMICIIDKENRIITFGKDWDYSSTTMKFLKWFIEDSLNISSSASTTRKWIKESGFIDGSDTEWTVVYDEELQ